MHRTPPRMHVLPNTTLHRHAGTSPCECMPESLHIKPCLGPCWEDVMHMLCSVDEYNTFIQASMISLPLFIMGPKTTV